MVNFVPFRNIRFVPGACHAPVLNRIGQMREMPEAMDTSST